jgi:hypothetical protein
MLLFSTRGILYGYLKKQAASQMILEKHVKRMTS